MSAPVTVIGNVNVDLVMGPQAPWPRPGTEAILPMSELRVGGAAGNTALALEALGTPHRLVANRGDDILGRWLAEPFGERAANWTISSGATTISVGITHPDGERTFFTTVGHVHGLRAADVVRQLADRAEPGEVALLSGCFVTPALMLDYEGLIGTLRARGYAVALDTGWPDGGWSEAARRQVLRWLPFCDHLLVNEIEATGLGGLDDLAGAAERLVSVLPAGATLVVKRGPGGALARRGAERAEAPSPAVEVVDTIGAGDIFNAGYLSARHLPLADAIRRGVAIASRAVSTAPRRIAA